MKKNTGMMRRAILFRLCNHLEEHYELTFPRSSFLDGTLTDHDLEAILAFKSDPWLEELQHALERLAGGTYGVCLSCKEALPQEQLDRDPLRRVCEKCETELSHAFHTFSSDMVL